MADLWVLIPTRGRPHVIAQLAKAYAATCTAGTSVSLLVDDNDPRLAEYKRLQTTGDLPNGGMYVGSAKSMVEALNSWAMAIARDTFAVGFCGDDHMPRTKGWDEQYLAALREMGTGIVYGNDLLQGHRLPTQCAMTSDIIRALGYMAPPTLRHLAVDNWWLELGNGAGCIRYLKDVIVEHRHPLAGKAAWDDGYLRVNSSAVAEHDLAEIARLRVEELPTAIAAVRSLMTVAA